jgi:hypothetical protein
VDASDLFLRETERSERVEVADDVTAGAHHPDEPSG